MSQVIKISRIEVKEGNNARGPWTNYIITGEDNVKASTFDKKAAALKVGTTIEAELELKGKFTNIKSFEVVGYEVIGHGSPPLKPDIVQPPAAVVSDEIDKRQSIESQVAAKIGAELMAAKIILWDSPLGKATIAWCLARLGGKLELRPEGKAEIHHIGWDGFDTPDAPGASIVPDKSTPVAVTKAGNPLLQDKPFGTAQDKAEDKAVASTECHIDLDRMKEKLAILKVKAPKAWGDAGLLSFMKTYYKVEAANPVEAAKLLDEGQAAHFTQKIKEALEMA